MSVDEHQTVYEVSSVLNLPLLHPSVYRASMDVELSRCVGDGVVLGGANHTRVTVTELFVTCSLILMPLRLAQE